MPGVERPPLRGIRLLETAPRKLGTDKTYRTMGLIRAVLYRSSPNSDASTRSRRPSDLVAHSPVRLLAPELITDLLITAYFFTVAREQKRGDFT